MNLFSLVLLTFSPRVFAGLLDEVKTAITDAVAFVETQYDAFRYGGEVPNTCGYYDACGDPMVNSLTGVAAPDWKTTGTPYHDLCVSNLTDDTIVVTELFTESPGITQHRELGVTFPETPDCAPIKHTSCAVNMSYEVPAMKLLTGTNAGDDDIVEALCVLRDLDLEARDQFEGILDFQNYVEYVYSTVGDTGALQMYPGVEWGGCPSSYDPRFRPWYASAVMGSKNVIFVLDYSLSMNSHGRRTLTEEALSQALATLNDNDYVGIVTFADDGVPFNPVMQPYTPNLACQIESYVDQLRTKYLTNYQGALDAAFDMLEASKTTGEIAACDTTVFVFLSDGEVYGAGYEGNELVEHIRDRNAAHGVRILTFVLGEETDATLANQISCDNLGLGYQIEDSGPLADAMAAYFRLYTAQMVPGSLPAMTTR